MENKKRKISVRKIMQVLVTVIVTAGCIVAIAGASKIEGKKHVNSIDIEIRNSSKCHFVDKEEILNMLVKDRHLDINNIPVTMLDVHSMEQIINSNPWVGAAEVYIDNVQTLHINVTQRIPVARVFEEDGNSYYIDTALRSMPLSPKYIYYTTVVTGVPELKDDSIGRAWRSQIIYLVRHIERDTFWNAQVSQIVMSPDRSFELVPVLGKQRILIGDTSRLDEKLDNLFAFYKKVVNRVGWDRYELIDLRFAGQVVASPSLPWNAPVDKSMSSMAWVTNILAAGSKDKDDDMPDTSKAAPLPSVGQATAMQPAAAPPVTSIDVKATPSKTTAIAAKPTASKAAAAPPPPAPVAVAATATAAVVGTAIVAHKLINKDHADKKEIKKDTKPEPKKIATPIVAKTAAKPPVTKTPDKPAAKKEATTVAKKTDKPVVKKESVAAVAKETKKTEPAKKEEKPVAKTEEHKTAVADATHHKDVLGPAPPQDKHEEKQVAAKQTPAKAPAVKGDEHKTAAKPAKKDDNKKEVKKVAKKPDTKKEVKKAVAKDVKKDKPKQTTQKQTNH